MSLLYIMVGIKHFIDPNYFMTIVPPYIVFKKEAVFISGLIEIFLGLLLLFRQTRQFAGWGIILLLIAVFPANIYLYDSETARGILGFSKNQALFRIPFQFTLITIAYWHSKKTDSKIFSKICIGLFIPTIIYFISISMF